MGIRVIFIGFIAGTIARLVSRGALIVLFIWNRLVAARVISDTGAGARYDPHDRLIGGPAYWKK